MNLCFSFMLYFNEIIVGALCCPIFENKGFDIIFHAVILVTQVRERTGNTFYTIIQYNDYKDKIPQWSKVLEL